MQRIGQPGHGKGSKKTYKRSRGKHQAIYNSKRWKITRQFILTRDDRRCTKCGKAGRLEVHHITPLSEGGDPYDPKNLKCLCRDCHFKEEPNRQPPLVNRLWLEAIDAET